MISAITNRGRIAFMVFSERFTARVLLNFLRRLLRLAKHKAYLIADQHPVHGGPSESLAGEAHSTSATLLAAVLQSGIESR